MSLKCAPVLAKIKEKVASADPNPANRKALHVYLINITQDGKVVKQYTMDLVKLETSEGAVGTPDATVTIEDEALALMGAKQLTQEEAIKQGKLKLEGCQVAISKFDLLSEKFKE